LSILEGLRKTIKRMKEERPTGGSPWELLFRHTTVVDELIRELHQGGLPDAVGRDMALVAVGGYGRRELSPWSDIDLMFLCRDTSSQSVIQAIYRVLHALWDMSLDVGHSVRTVEDCLEVSLRDIPTWTALMDARFLMGDEDLFHVFRERMWKDLFVGRREEFVQRLVQGMGERHRKYARTPFLVEPNLKEGPGGLRDLQCALWLARARFPVHETRDLVEHALISLDEAQELESAHTFLWRVRLALHRLAGRKEDQLTFSLQERLAETGEFGEESGSRSVESFMKHFYRHTTRVRYFVEDLAHKATDPSLAAGPKGPTFAPGELGEGFLVVRGRLTLLDDRVFERDPPRILEALGFAHKEGIALDIFIRDQLKESLHLIDGRFRRSRRVREAFLSLLDTPDCGYRALEIMHRLGVLQAYIPEFHRVCFQVQHDAYHAYTVDVHSLETVAELGRMRSAPGSGRSGLWGQVSGRIRNWPPLVLAALLHDIGKGSGPGHAERGAAMAETLLRRMGLPKKERERVIFLIRHHLLLMDTALGRDLTEEKVIADFCRSVETLEQLDDLYLLTLADLRATGPDLLTDWKDQLLRELFLKARRLLETGELVTPEAAKGIREAKERIRAVLAEVIPEKHLDRWIESLPGRYLLTTPPEDLVDQVLMAWLMVQSGQSLRVHCRRSNGVQEIVICTRDAPALFSRICGVMVAHGFNILGARIHTWTNGLVMDTFRVEPASSGEASDEDRVKSLAEDLAAVLEGKEDLERLIAKRAPSIRIGMDRHPSLTPRVKIDNRSSDFYTLVEVRARDRFGLLFTITRTLSSLDLNIHLALVDTRRGQVMDVFYVQDATGQKILDESRLSQVERDLRRALERMEESDPWTRGSQRREERRW